MSEFGHEYSSGACFHIYSWGSGPFVINAGGVDYKFEDSDRFGPALVSEIGDILEDPYPPEKCEFWRAHSIWIRQGRRVEGEKCIWNEPKPLIIRHTGGRHWAVVDGGEEDAIVIKLNRDGQPVKKKFRGADA